MSALIFGVDGGGSKTRVVVADEQGVELARVEGGPCAVRPGHAGASASVIARTVQDALAAAGRLDVRPTWGYLGIAGVGRETDRQALWQALGEKQIADDIVVESDAAIALHDAFGDGPGIILIAGTGSVAYGRGPTGAFERCGGWGPVIGDEGGGAWIGRKALSIATAAEDGREPQTALTGAMVTAAQVERVDDLVAWAANASAADLASLASAVMHCAEAGDQRAETLLGLAVEELVLHVRALARSLFVDERAAISIAFVGGLLTKGSAVRKRLEHRVKSAVPGAQLIPKEVDPVRGAVALAIKNLATTSPRA